MAVDIGALVTFSRIGSKLVQIGWSANPPQFNDIGHQLAIFTNPCPILIRLDWMIAIRFKKSGVLYIRVYLHIKFTSSSVIWILNTKHRVVLFLFFVLLIPLIQQRMISCRGVQFHKIIGCPIPITPLIKVAEEDLFAPLAVLLE